jgi:hypothetical protein
MNDELLALIGRELCSGGPESARRRTGVAGARAGLGSAGDRLLAWPQGDRTHPRHRRGGPRVSEGDLRRTDF